MKIVINAYSARLGGGQTYLRNLLAHLPSMPGVEIVVYAPPELALPESPRVRRANTWWPVQNPLLRVLWERFALPAVLRRERADILFCPGGVVGTKVPPGCRVVTMFRNMIPFDAALVDRMPWNLQKLRNLILRRVLLRSMAEADLTIFISNHARALIEGLTRVPNAVTIPHGISKAFRTDGQLLPRPEGVSDVDYVLYVSRFDLYKHHCEVVRGFAALPESLRTGLQLVFLGETDLPGAKAVEHLVQQLNLQAQVLMPGAVPHSELPAWYQHARIIVFASSCENCPNILLESLGAGRPVLSSDVMPMPEFGGSGLRYFSPFEPASLAQALTTVLSSAQEEQRLAEAARERSMEYEWSVTARKTWEQLFALADQRIASSEKR